MRSWMGRYVPVCCFQSERATGWQIPDRRLFVLDFRRGVDRFGGAGEREVNLSTARSLVSFKKSMITRWRG